jgi:hypothetical protein
MHDDHDIDRPNQRDILTMVVSPGTGWSQPTRYPPLGDKLSTSDSMSDSMKLARHKVGRRGPVSTHSGDI